MTTNDLIFNICFINAFIYLLFIAIIAINMTNKPL